jgi:hypothetical protein
LSPRPFPLICVLALLGLLAVAPSAQARVYSVFPSGVSEEPVEHLLDNDALFVIGTTDMFGGRLCVVAAAATSGSCDAPAWGSPNHVSGLGTFIIPIEAPVPDGRRAVRLRATTKVAGRRGQRSASTTYTLPRGVDVVRGRR